MGRLLERAISLAIQAHSGQVDKMGKPYILHPLRVMSNFLFDENKQIVSVLHDIVEDTPVTIDDLRDTGLLENNLNSISLLTKIKNEDYFEYIKRITSSNDIDAISVKYYDLLDNAHPRRNKFLSKKDVERRDKYFVALSMIKEAMN